MKKILTTEELLKLVHEETARLFAGMEKEEQKRAKKLLDRRVVLCQFHEEKTPSMMIDGDSFHCFSCGKEGNVSELPHAS